MKPIVCLFLVGHGLLLAGLALLVHQANPELARPAMQAGLAGGFFSLLWGGLGLAGRSRRGWAIATLGVTGFILLTQAVSLWMPSGQIADGHRSAGWMVTLMTLATLGALMVVAHATDPGGRPDSNAKTR